MDSNLLESFSPPPPSALDGSVTAPPERAPKWKPPVAEDARPEESSAFVTALGKVQRAISQKKWAEAQAALSGTVALARAAGPAAQQRAFDAAAAVAIGQRNELALLRAVTGLLHACGPAAVDGCRRRALGYLGNASIFPTEGERLRTFERDTRRSDDCLQAAEAIARAGGAQKMLPCLAASLRSYRKSGDRLMVARALYAEASSSRAGGRAQLLQKLGSAERACGEERCQAVRARIVHDMVPLFVDAGELRAAARLLLRQIKLSSSRVPSAALPYVRTPELDALCETLETTAPRASCHALEKSVLGRYIFRDFSRELAPGKGLSAAAVQKVSREYSVLLEQCLTAAAKRQPHPESARFGVHWMVRNDGHVEQVHLDNKDAEASPVGDCFRSVLAQWRYPRYAGELQHVDQQFEVHVSSRPVVE